MQSILLTVLLVAVIGLVGAIILTFASRALAVEEDTRVADLVDILPGLNCGSCGNPGCEGYAKKLLQGAPTNMCQPGGDAVARQVADYLGVEVQAVTERRACVACHGAPDRIRPTEAYDGPKTCRSFATMGHATKSCTYGCIGFGDCAAACPFDAIQIGRYGVAGVNHERCTGCGTCVDACPRGLISLQERGRTNTPFFVYCKNEGVGKAAKEGCANVCLGCGQCAKACSQGCLPIAGPLAHIDTTRCIGCQRCVDVCPSGAILALAFSDSRA